MSTKATLYLDEKVFRALKVRAALSDRTVSETANAMIRQALAGGPGRAPGAAKVGLGSEGSQGFPVLNLEGWPDGYVFERESVYEAASRSDEALMADHPFCRQRLSEADSVAQEMDRLRGGRYRAL